MPFSSQITSIVIASIAGIALGAVLVTYAWSPLPKPLSTSTEFALTKSQSVPSTNRSPNTQLEVSSRSSVTENLLQAFSETSEIAAMRALLTALDRHHPETAAEFAGFFKQHPYKQQHATYWKLFFSSWGSFDPSAAVAFAQVRFKEATRANFFIASILRSSVDQDIEGTLDIARSILPKGTGNHGELALEALEKLITHDPALATRGLAQLSDPEMVMELAGNRITELSKEDLPGALAQWDSTEGEARAFLLGKIASALAETDPIAAADLITGNGHPSIAANDLASIASQYMAKDPVSAFEWIAKIPKEKFSENLLEASVSAWALADLSGARQWLATHEPAPEFDSTIAAISKTIAKTDPALGIESSAQLIHDAARSEETLFHLAMGWQEESPTEFSQWLQNTPLIPDHQKSRLAARELHVAPPATTPLSPAIKTSLDNGRL